MPPSIFDGVNRNGAEICHAVGCRRHKRLREKFRGRFCDRHIAMLEDIRAEIIEAKTSGDVFREVRARYQEALFRKTMEPGHMSWLLKLEMTNPFFA